jgi:serine/threonine-protein kinase HipA
MILIVYLNQTKLGTLATKNNKIYFEYDKDFLKSGIEISPYKLPLKRGVFRCDDNTFDGLWGVFSDSLPDGWGRLLMDREFLKRGVKLQDVSPLDRLALVGKDGMGALEYEPVSEFKSIIDEIILDDLASGASEILKGSSEEIIDELFALGGSSAGARPKVLVQVSRDFKEIIDSKKALQDGFEHYIIKFASRYDSNDVALIEYVYNQIAIEAGLDVPKFHLFKGKNGYYFGAKRFDRIKDKKVHMHSVAGLIHSDFRYPTLDYNDLLKLTLHLTKNFKEQEKMFRLACFNMFANNRDDHAKNFSFLLNSKNEWVLSPTYDLTYSFGPGGEHSTLYAGEGRYPTLRHLEQLAKENGIQNYQYIIEKVKEAVNKWQTLAKNIGVSKNKIKEIDISIQENLKR